MDFRETGFEGLKAEGDEIVVGCPAWGTMISTAICDGSKTGVACNHFKGRHDAPRPDGSKRMRVWCAYPRELEAWPMFDRLAITKE